MQEPRYTELGHRASEFLKAAQKDEVKRLEAEATVGDVIEQMKNEGKALVLSDEEEQMLRSFRKFKLRMSKNGEVFKWQTRLPEGVTLAEETGLIAHPQER